MKNKRLIGIIAALAVLVAGSLIYSSMNKSEAQNNKDEKKITKIGVLQFVSHPSLDLIYKGIQDGLAEEGYKDDQVKIDFMNSEGDQSKVATMINNWLQMGMTLWLVSQHQQPKGWLVQQKTYQLSWPLLQTQLVLTWLKI
ncbi:ABC transporter substrate-binding protein [Streptococcus pneumoniae]|nr:ABC transporter substrate-binding protein [Streptococcus pneumoniae]